MITNPIIILGTPRSGTTILQRCLALHPDLWHLPGESHTILEGPFHPAPRGYSSNRVTAKDVSAEIAQHLRTQFYNDAINLNRIIANPAQLFRGNGLIARVYTKLAIRLIGQITNLKKPSTIRFLEKTPKNTLRIPMLDRLFPDALFIWIKRRAPENIDSLISGWYAVDKIGPCTRQRYAAAGYPIADQLNLQDYKDKWWKFALVPEWRTLHGKTVADVAAWQYYQCNRYIVTDFGNIDPKRILVIEYEEFVQRPVETVKQIFHWAELPANQIAEDFARDLPQINTVTSGNRRSLSGLRYPQAVRFAIQNLPELQLLEGIMKSNSSFEIS